MPSVSIIIPAFDHWSLTRQCLESLAAHLPVECGGEVCVVLVDNGSTDATPSEAPDLGRALFGMRFTHLRLNANLGFSLGCNAGARVALGDLLLFLNNDTVAESDFLTPLMRRLEAEPGLGAVGPLLTFPPDACGVVRVQHLGVAVGCGPVFQHVYESFPVEHPLVRRARPLQAVTAAAVLLTRDTFEAAGGFHDGYVNGCEDLDLCARLRRQGLGVAMEPGARLTHLAGQTLGRHAHETDNFRLLMDRCDMDFRPDLDTLIRPDGYAVAVNEWLEAYVALPMERAPQGKDVTDVDALCAGLAAEPLWDTGHALLVRELERAGNADDAMDAARLRFTLCPTLTALRGLLRQAKAAGDERARAQAEATLVAVGERLRDPARLARLARVFAAQARDAGQDRLAAAYEGWIGSGRVAA